jgi:hypothetical protein
MYNFTLFFLLIMQTTEPVLIRVENASDQIMKDVEVRWPFDSVRFGDIEPRAVSRYIKVVEAYRIGQVHATVGGRRLNFTPDDYLGEQFLPPGKYDYVIDVASKGEIHYLTLTFRK